MWKPQVRKRYKDALKKGSFNTRLMTDVEHRLRNGEKHKVGSRSKRQKKREWEKPVEGTKAKRQNGVTVTQPRVDWVALDGEWRLRSIIRLGWRYDFIQEVFAFQKRKAGARQAAIRGLLRSLYYIYKISLNLFF